MSDAVTILKSKGPLLTKRWTAGGILPYDRAKNFTWEQANVAGIHELSEVLTDIESQATCCVIRGQIIDAGLDETTRDLDHFEDVPRHWVCLDVDDFEPVLCDPVTEPSEAVAEFIVSRLPRQFHSCSHHWQLSSSAGAPGNEGKLKAHIWFWLSEPRRGAELEVWARKTQTPVDITVFRPVQVHYTAAPVIDPDVRCPVAQRSGFVQGSQDEVHLDFNPAWAAEVHHPKAPLEVPEGVDADAAAFMAFDASKRPNPNWTLERVRDELLPHLDPDCGRDPWLKIGMALHHQGRGDDEWLGLWDEWSQGSGKYQGGDCQVRWDSFDCDDPRGTTLASLLHETREARAAVSPPAPPPVAAQQLTDQQKHDAVLQRYLDQIPQIDTPSYLEGEFAGKMQQMDWTRAERLRVAKAMRDQYKALTGTLVGIDIAKAWVEPVAGPTSFPDVTGDGRILGTHRNVESLLTQLKATVRYNVIAKEDEITIPGHDFTKDNIASASVALLLSECNAVDMKINASVLKSFVTLIADSNQYNPALDWITSKPWDGVDRFADWCATVVSPNPYVKEIIMRRWALQAIAVLFNTGKFQARGVLTFSGVQYAGKSRWLRSLAPEGMVHTGHLLDVHNKDSIKIAIACWICELGEIDGTLRKSDLAALKAFISQELDTFRRPYAIGESTYPRKTVFGATVNEQRYLRDTTGNTRFWSIAVDSINPDHDVDMQQFWAQMLVLWQGGEQHWMTEEEMRLLNTSNEEFTVTDPVEEILRTKLDWESDKSTWVRRSAVEIAESLGMKGQSLVGLSVQVGKALKRITGLESKSDGHARRSLVPRLRSEMQDFPDS